jgi:DNA-binding transcriptional ArsR family regulator
MDKSRDELSGVFQAFADPTRRAVLNRLGAGPASVSDLAEPFAMALPSFMKHIRFLEGAGLIRTQKHGRVRTCEIDRKRFAAAEAWLAEQRAVWEGRADRLEQFVAKMQNKDGSR